MEQDYSGALWMSGGFLVIASAFMIASLRTKDPVSAGGAWLVGGFALFWSWTMLSAWLGYTFIGPWAVVVWFASLFAGGIASIIWEKPTPYHGDMDPL